MVKFFKWLWRAIAHASQAWQIWVWLVPASATSALTGILSNAAGLRHYQVMIAASIVFALTSISVAAIYHALLRRAQYIKTTSVAGQLQFAAPHLAYDFAWDSKNKLKSVTGMNLGVVLHNQSQKTIRYRIEYFHARVEGLSPDTRDYVGKLQEIGPQSGKWFSPGLISFGPNQKTQLSGTLEFKIVYGEYENLEFQIEKKFEFDLFPKKELSKHPIGIVAPAFRELL
jgi:hypothetical protein